MRFAVTIQFTDGEYRNRVTAESIERALELAITDARMASPYGSFYGAVLAQEATPI